MVLIGNSIHASQALGRPIFAFKADSKIFDEVFEPLLDAESNKTIVGPIFNLDDDFPIQKRTKIKLDFEQVWPHPYIYATSNLKCFCFFLMS